MVFNLNLIRVGNDALYSTRNIHNQRSVKEIDDNISSTTHDTHNQESEKKLVQKPLDDSYIERFAKSYLVSKEVMKIYFETEYAYAEETGADFSTMPLGITMFFLFGRIGMAESIRESGIDMPKYTLEDLTRPPVPKPRRMSIIDHLHDVLDDISHRDEAWVRRQTYAPYAETPMGKAYIEEMVVGYRHMTELTKRFIDALQRATDPNANQAPISTHLLDVVV